MPVNIEEIVERALEQAFSKALDQAIQKTAEALFKKVFKKNGSVFGRRLEKKIGRGFERFVEEGIQWEKKRTGFETAAKQQGEEDPLNRGM